MRAAIFVLLTLITSVFGADWTGAVWEPIVSREQGKFLGGLKGLHCRGDSLYLAALVDSNDSGSPDTYELYRITFAIPVLDDILVELIPLPDDIWLLWFDMGYDSVDRRYPALASGDLLWRMRGDRWNSLLLSEDASRYHPTCFAFDSSGALHYVLGTSGWGSENLQYRRRFGNQPPRDTTFQGNFEYVWATYNQTRIWAPSSTSILIAMGSQDVPFENGFWSLHFKSSAGDDDFVQQDSTLILYGLSPQACLSEWGDWCYGLIRRSSGDPTVRDLMVTVSQGVSGWAP
jgi:hypothetical protein